MRGILSGLGALFALLLLGGLGLGVWVFSAIDRGGQSARAYVDSAVPAITAHWDASELTARADPALLARTDAAKIKLQFVWLSTLGPLETYQGAAMQATNVDSGGPAGTVTTVRMLAAAQYAHGDANIDLLLVQRGAGWRILAFRVNSEALPRQEAPERL